MLRLKNRFVPWFLLVPLICSVFHPNPLASALDMDFGGQKEITVYDPSTKTNVLRTKITGQAGASLSPDGHHLAVIDPQTESCR